MTREKQQAPHRRPPYSNRGVYPPTVGGALVPAFDAYCASVFAHYQLLSDGFRAALVAAGEEVRLEPLGKVRFYGGGINFVDPTGHSLGVVKHGGSNPHPFLEVKGRASPIAAQFLRSTFQHRPSRVDSAVDMAGPDLFGELVQLARSYEGKGLRLDYAGAAVDHPTRGTTLYLGSRQSQVFVRIYQKGLQLAEQMGLDAVPPEYRDWVRVELQFQPQKKPAKEAATILSPRDCWGTSPWTHEFAMEAFSLKAERVNVYHRRESDHERALRAMGMQYARHLEQLVTDCGGDLSAAMEVLLDYAGLAVPKAA